MSTYKNWMIQNNRIAAPLLALVLSLLVTLGSIYIIGELMFLVPVVTFFAFHYTRLYRIKLRLLGGTIVFLVVAIVSTGLLTHVIYNSQPTYHAVFTDGSTANTSVSPYSGSSSQYTYSILIVPNGTFDYNSLVLNIRDSGGAAVASIHYKDMQNQTFAGNNTELLTYTYSGITNPGIYTYNLTVLKNGNLSSTVPISGPLNTSELNVFSQLVVTYVVYDMFLYEIIFIAGIFIGRSIGNSRRYRQQSRPPENGPPQ